jgi:hypothetical protein
MDLTFDAVCQAESRSGRDPRCWVELPTGELGPAQIRPGRVDDVNRIIGREVYTLSDRLDPAKCREMFLISCRHYWPEAGPEQWARHWNGSPSRGPRQAATQGYWSKVRSAMEGGAR